MELKEAITILENPTELGQAIDKVVSEFKNLSLSGVVKSLKDKEEIAFKDWLKYNYTKTNNYTYQHKKSLQKRDGHQVRNAYKLITEHL